jgi:hypothetical protein
MATIAMPRSTTSPVFVYWRTTLVAAYEEATPRASWRKAIAHMRAIEESRGDWSPAGPGRHGYQCGDYRAVTARRA